MHNNKSTKYPIKYAHRLSYLELLYCVLKENASKIMLFGGVGK